MEVSPLFYYKLLARPCVIITTRFRNNKTNAAPFSFITPISFKPPYIGFACDPRHDTWKNINEKRQFIINIVNEKIFDKLKILAKTYPYGISEVEEAGLKESEGKVVKVKRIKDAIAWIECELNRFFYIGDHIFIVGKVLHCEAKKGYWNEEERFLDVKKGKVFFHITNDIFAVKPKLQRVEVKEKEETKDIIQKESLYKKD